MTVKPNPFYSHVVKTEHELRRFRAAQAVRNFKFFAKQYFPHLRGAPDSIMHKELYKLLQQFESKQGEKVAIAAPRGNAKSTIISQIFILWMICSGRVKFVLLLSDTKNKAENFLSNIKDELQNSETLQQDFPSVCELKGQRPAPRRWRKSELETRNGVLIFAAGAGQSIRGSRFKQHRPDLIILDDIENEDNTTTPESREKLSAWFHRVVEKAGAPQTNLIMVGTIQHYDSLLAHLTNEDKNTVWQSRIYRSVISWSNRLDLWEQWSKVLHGAETYSCGKPHDQASSFFEDHEKMMMDGTRVLWPERESYYQLMLMRETEGEWAFNAEKQNDPINPKDCYFNPDQFTYWDDKFESPDHIIQHFKNCSLRYNVYAACDPSMGKQNQRADYSAIIVVFHDVKFGQHYIVDADIQKRKPDVIIEHLVEYAKIRNIGNLGIEDIQFQELFKDLVEKRFRTERGVHTYVQGVGSKTDKIGRIQSIQPLIASGKLMFSRKHKLLLQQFREFPKGAHDDGPDAVEMALRVNDYDKRVYQGTF